MPLFTVAPDAMTLMTSSEKLWGLPLQGMWPWTDGPYAKSAGTGCDSKHWQAK